MKLELAKTFETKDLVEAKVCLGLEIERRRDAGQLRPMQSKYASSVLGKFGMDSATQ